MEKKINRKAVEWFRKSEIPELRKKGVIPTESLDALELYYAEQAAQQGSTGTIVTIILYSIGALLVMLGISLIIAHNWDSFPDRVRLAMGFAPLAAGAIFGLYALWTKKGPAWREPAAIVYGVGIATALAVTTQVYYLGGELRSFLLAWLCLLIPVPFVFRSFGALILTLAVSVFWTCRDFRTQVHWLHVMIPLIPGSSLIALMYRKADSVIGVWCRYLLVPYALLYSVPFFCWSGKMASLSFWLAMTGAMCVLGCRMNSDRMFGFFRNPLPAAGFLSGFFVLMGLCTRTATCGGVTSHSEFALPCYAAMLLPLSGILYSTLKKPQNWLGFLSLLPVAALLLSYHSAVSGIVMTCTSLVIMTILFVIGTKRSSLSCLNAAMLLVIGLMFVWFMESKVSTLTRGCLFIVAGLLFAGVNVLILKRRKQGGLSHA